MKKKKYELDDAGREAAKLIVDEWRGYAFRTGVMSDAERETVKDSVEALYRIAGRRAPPRHRIVIAPSPMVARFAAGAAAWIWYCRKNDAALDATYTATLDATDAATYDATLAATYAATLDATDAATRAATYAATYDATDAATYAATYDATLAATYDATRAATYAATLDATDAATYDATRDATYDATLAAAYNATYTATLAATYDATYTATLAATYAATYDATLAATYTATLAATYAATYDATLAATYTATLDATDAATYDATDAATYDATYDATLAAAYNATYDATRAAAYNATRAAWVVGGGGCACAVMEVAGRGGILCADLSSRFYQGGSAWCSWDSFVAFGRDHARLADLGLVKPEIYENYAPWEALAKLSGFRFLHEEFCIVSDRPLEYHLDDANRPHCDSGPFVRWSDGSAFYSWHGVRIPARWVEDRANLDPNEVIRSENVELRAAGAAIVGWPKMLSVLESKIIDDSGSDDIGQLIELKLPGLEEPGRFLKARCPRNGIIVEGVPRVSDIDGLPINTAIAAQAWRIGDPQSEYTHPPRRT